MATKTTRRKNTAAEKKRVFHQQMAAVIAFGAGLLITALTFIAGENVWRFLHSALFGLFGLCTYAVGPLICYLSLDCALKKRSILWPFLIALGALAFGCGLLQLMFSPELAGNNFFDKFVNLWATGSAKQGGGLLFCVIGWPLSALCGRIGAVLIMCITLFVGLMIYSGKTLVDLHKSVSQPVKQAGQMIERQMEKREQQRQKKAAIDIDLGNTHPIDIPLDEEPPTPVSASIPVSAPVEELSAEGDRQTAVPVVDDIFDEDPIEPFPVGERTQPLGDIDELVSRVAAEQQGPSPAEIFSPSGAQKPAPATGPELPFAAAEEKNSSPLEGAVEVMPPIDLVPAPAPGQAPPYKFPPVSILDATRGPANADISNELRQNADRLVDTLKSFGVQTRIINISRGPAVTRYELQPNAGVKISKITNLADDIALNLAAVGVRIEAPIPGKAAVGIEVPNRNVSVVGIRELLGSDTFRTAASPLTVALGKDIAGAVKVADIGKMPHVLIAGATGSGKSVCINSIILSLLYKSSPEEVRLLMVDPKVVELGIYNGIPHLLVPVVTDPHKAAGALGWAVTEMLNRYKLFAANNVRDIGGYNKLCEARADMEKLPRIVIIIDELADLMMAAPGEVEDAICRLAQMARAAGMHLIIATQRPSVDVITGVIKANIPSRIAFAVSSQIDSRTILDGSGAEKLLGKGDMLYFPVGASKPTRLQGCFVTDEEIERVVEFIKPETPKTYDEQIIEEIEKQATAEKGKGGSGGDGDEDDDMLPDAIEVAIDLGQISTSMLQRKLKLGYARAARIIDAMEEKGIISGFEGSKPRRVLITRQQWLEMNAREQ